MLTYTLVLNKDIILCGDFNIDLLTDNSLEKRFCNILEDFNFVPTINTYTRIANNSRTCIDNFLVFKNTEFTEVIVNQSCLSDHTYQAIFM